MTDSNKKEQQDKPFQLNEKLLVTILLDLSAKVDALQRSQASLKPEIVEHIYRILTRRWSDEAARRRERCW